MPKNMEKLMKLDAFAVPRGTPSGEPVVHVSIYHDGFALHQRLSMDEAEYAVSRLAGAIAAIKQGSAFAAGTDPRDRERRYRATLAIRLGLTKDDVRAVFDMDEAEYTRLVEEVNQ